jgi:hypothetical protein
VKTQPQRDKPCGCTIAARSCQRTNLVLIFVVIFRDRNAATAQLSRHNRNIKYIRHIESVKRVNYRTRYDAHALAQFEAACDAHTCPTIEERQISHADMWRAFYDLKEGAERNHAIALETMREAKQ